MPRWARSAACLALLTGAYFLAGRLGLALAVINPSASPVWPPTGIALGAFLIGGPRMWPAIFIGAFLVNHSTASAVLPSIGIAIGNTLEGLVGMYLVGRFANGRAAFDRSRDFFAFVMLAGFLSTAVSATVGTSSLALTGGVSWPQFWSVWVTWWLGNAAGNVVVAPLVVLWFSRPRPRWTPAQWSEVLLLIVAVFVVAVIVFVKSSYPVEFLAIPICVWAGTRFGAREASTATAVLAGVAVWAAVRGAGPFASQPPNTALLLTQMFMVVTQIAGVGIGAAVAEMTSAHRMLHRLKEQLEEQVSARTSELQTSQARLAEAQEIAHIGSWEWDARSERLTWSEELYRIYGAVPGTFEPTYETFVAMVHPRDRERVEQIARRAMAGGQPFEAEFRLLRADGVARIGYTRGRGILDANGQPLRLVGIVQDATDQRELDTRLRQAQKLEALGLLAGGIAHDFNNLITAIGGYTELALSGLPAADPRRGDLFEVRKAAERAAGLTRRLLAFSRSQTLQLKVVDVNAVVTGLQALLRRTIGENIDVTLDLDARLSPVRVDPDQLEQVVLNIALNARDAMPDGGELRFTTTLFDADEEWARQHPPVTAGHYVRLTIADTGVGMAPEVQARIFEPFFTTKAPGAGTGFGLATVYGIVKQSGGFILVSSTPGQGTVFDIFLPAHATATDSHVPETMQAGAAAAGGGETILIVEDDGAVRRLARDVLMQAGYQVIEARDGDDALARTRAHPAAVDLLITDVVMPGLTGRELAARMEDACPGVRVLYTSGYAKGSTAGVGIEPTAPFLPKPFLPVDLLEKVREVLSGAAGVPV